MTPTISAEQYRKGGARKPSKYKNVPVYLIGAVVTTDREHAKALAKGTGVKVVRFASKAEYQRDNDLHGLQRGGKIRNLIRQPRFPLKVDGQLICTYVADWQYEEDIGAHWNTGIRKPDWQLIVDDRKGALTKDFKIKWALAKALHPEIEWRLS